MVYLQYDKQIQPLASLASGQFFGEGALLKGKGAVRGASVKAVAYSLIYSLHVDAVNQLLTHHPKVMQTIEAIAHEREEATATMSVRTFGRLPTQMGGPTPPTQDTAPAPVSQHQTEALPHGRTHLCPMPPKSPAPSLSHDIF